MTIPFEEFNESPKIDISADGQRGTRTGRVAWGDLSALVNYLFPLGSIVTAQMPSYPLLRARSLHIEPSIGNNTRETSGAESLITNINQFATAKVTINYEASSNYYQDESAGSGNNVDPVLLLQHRWSIGGEFLTLPSSGFEWCDGEEISKELTLGKLIPTIEHQITWPRVPNPPFSAMKNLLGKINNASMTFRTGPILPETLLFLGAELQRDILSSGVLAWEVSYRFSERRVPVADVECSPMGVSGDTTVGGWNHFFRSDSPLETDSPKTGFYRIRVKAGNEGAANPVFALGDLSQLFIEESA